MKSPTIESSCRLSGICSLILIILMIGLRKVFRLKAEATFFGGFFGAILFFFLIIFYSNSRAKRNNNTIGWFELALCELVALIVSLIVHPVCITTCLLFSVPVVVYVKWASTKLAKESESIPKKNKRN